MAKEAGKKRSQRAEHWNIATKSEYGLKITVTERTFEQINDAAFQKANASVPKTSRDVLAHNVGHCSAILLVAFLISVLILPWLYMAGVKVNMLLMFGGILAGPVGGVLHAICASLERPRLEAVRTLTEKCLREGLKQFEAEQLEYLKFYMTPEWRSLRAATVRRKGKTCNLCGIRILNDRDVTVDHILPRSVYPDRALDPENLQVLCRSCNSAKGARVETESDGKIQEAP